MKVHYSGLKQKAKTRGRLISQPFQCWGLIDLAFLSTWQGPLMTNLKFPPPVMKGIELCFKCEQQHSFRPCPFLKTGGVRKWKLFQQEGQSIKLLISYLQNDSDKIWLNELACLSGKVCSHSQFIHFWGIELWWHWDKITLVRGNPRLQDLCLTHRKVHELQSEVMQRNAFEVTNCVQF